MGADRAAYAVRQAFGRAALDRVAAGLDAIPCISRGVFVMVANAPKDFPPVTTVQAISAMANSVLFETSILASVCLEAREAAGREPAHRPG